MKTLRTMTKVFMKIDAIETSLKIRRSHLKKRGEVDEVTDEALERIGLLTKWGYGIVGSMITAHPAYPWFSKIRGVGHENIAKILVDIRIKEEFSPKGKPLGYAKNISSLWSYAGMGVTSDGIAVKRAVGTVSPFNMELKTMCWRLGTAILQAGLRQKCSVCGELVGRASTMEDADPDKQHTCKGATFTTVSLSKFGWKYLEFKEAYQKRILSEGKRILPTPTGNWACMNCGVSWGKKADITECCDDQEIGKKVKSEPPGVVYEGHVHNYAVRKMVKLFLACLWLVWRDMEGLPVTCPYPIDILGHSGIIEPWEMIDEEVEV